MARCASTDSIPPPCGRSDDANALKQRTHECGSGSASETGGVGVGANFLRGVMKLVAVPAPSLPLTGRVARSLERAGWGAVPPPQRRKSAAGPPRKGEVWSLLPRYDETCDSVAAALLSVRLMSKSEGCGAPSGRVLFLVGSLSAPRLRRYVEPLPLAYRLFRGPPIVTGRDGPGLSNPGGGQTSP
jgi:hypothetical protein